MEPKFDLEIVKQLIENEVFENHCFSLTRALNPVVYRLQKTHTEAKEFILEQILKLEVKNFSESVLIQRDVYDVYGKKIDGISWYIKFSILEDAQGKFLYSISFHPIEKNLKTNIETLEP